MAAFKDEDMRPEEKSGGFNSETPGDETFFSENQDDYPGTMPDFSVFDDEPSAPETEPPAPATEKSVAASAVESPVSSNKKRSLLKILVVAAILILISAIAADIYRSNREEKTETSEDESSQNIGVIEEVVEDDQSVYSESVPETEVIDDFVEPMIIEDQFLIEVSQTPVEPVETHKTARHNKPVQTPSQKSAPVKVEPIKQDKPKAPSAGSKLYTVQVYSSPSKDDAEVWLARLIKKNVNSAFITTKMIRNTIMYRVRFGAFSTQAEAKKAAIKQGFDQTWIDRVR